MKITWNSLVVVLILLLLTACNSQSNPVTVKEGTYVLVQKEVETFILPSVTISNDEILFTYDHLSSYLPYGTYTIEEDILTMITNDKKYEYVFQVDGDKLIFLKNKSSRVGLIDSRIGVEITDKAEFTLKSSNLDSAERLECGEDFA